MQGIYLAEADNTCCIVFIHLGADGRCPACTVTDLGRCVGDDHNLVSKVSRSIANA